MISSMKRPRYKVILATMKRDIHQVETFNTLRFRLVRVTDKEFDVVKKGMLPYSTIIKKVTNNKE